MFPNPNLRIPHLHYDLAYYRILGPGSARTHPSESRSGQKLVRIV